mmetsp:Transcript_20843/g.29977  ORF Transcript_20843/g.29977 Transcript_20843/m.29977 type:complete len:415 (-) Transcript_20843:76-1320(-)
MGEETEYKPSQDEFLVTGLFGTFLYLLLAAYIGVALRKSPKNEWTKIFFILMLLMCVFEVPRFLVIAVKMEYASRSLYIVHIVSSMFFFGAFSVVCVQWSGLLKLGVYISIVYSMGGLLTANVVFGLSDLVAIIMCGLSSSLHDFFKSSFFEAYTFIDTIKNLMYSGFLAFYGVKLIVKFYRYSSIELNQRLFADRASDGNQSSVFSTALSRLTGVLVTVTICFMVRVCMLILKTVALHSERTVSSPTAPLFGFLWFCASDFVPRCVPSFAFVYLMQSKRRSRREGSNTQGSDLHKGLYSTRRSLQTSIDPYSGKFTYVGDEDEEDSQYSDEGSSYAGGGYSYASDDEEEVVYLDSSESRRMHSINNWSPQRGKQLASLAPLGSHAKQSPSRASREDDDISLTSFTSLSQISNK